MTAHTPIAKASFDPVAADQFGAAYPEHRSASITNGRTIH